jgi:hypothetical protein
MQKRGEVDEDAQGQADADAQSQAAASQRSVTDSAIKEAVCPMQSRERME